MVPNPKGRSKTQHALSKVHSLCLPSEGKRANTMTESRMYQVGMWVMIIMFAAQSAFYGLWAIPTLHQIIEDDRKHIEWLAFINDGCYEVKVQFNDMYEEYHYLTPELNSKQYTLRLKLK